VAIHGGKDMEFRLKAVEDFKQGRKDILVATDVASKGLDFADIQHVINYDMPDDIENYGKVAGRHGCWAHPAHMLQCIALVELVDTSVKVLLRRS
jgi:superfamily II DNA/RNA helicase